MQKRFFLQTAVTVLLLAGVFVGPLHAQRFRQIASKNNKRAQPSTRSPGTGGTKTTPPKAPQAPAVAKQYAILVGVNEYEQQRKLDFCDKDMQGLKDALIKGKFTTADCIEVLVTGSTEKDKTPTMANINRALKNLAAKTNENDTVLFAFAGHGVSLPSRKGEEDFKQYLCPADAKVEFDADTGKFYTDTLLPLEDIDRMIVENSKAKTRIMFLDACRDQDVVVKTRSLVGMTPNIDDVRLGMKGFASQKLDTGGLFRLSSCAENQKAYEDKDTGHGVFSYHLIEGLNGKADADNNGRVTLDELKDYVSRKTKDHVFDKFYEAKQVPTFSAMDSYGSSPIMAMCEQKKVEPIVIQPSDTGSGGTSGNGRKPPNGGGGNNSNSWLRFPK